MILSDDLCPLCYRSTLSPQHRRWFNGDLVCCEAELLAPSYPRDPETCEPLLPQLRYVDDEWMFGVACVHVMMRAPGRALLAIDAFRRRWPVGGALLFEPNPCEALLDHYHPYGLATRRARLTWDIADRGINAFTAYPGEALRVLAEFDLAHPARDARIEAWRRWRCWQMGVEA